MRLVAAILFVMVSACGLSRADVWRPAASFTLSSPWSYVFGGDTPEGGWYANPGATANTLTMSVHLGTNLPAGNYAVGIKSDDYDYYWDTHITAGGTTVTNYTSDRDVNGSWSLFAVLNAATAFTNITIVFSNEVAIAGLKTGIEGIFLTENTDSYMLTSSEYIRLTLPSTNSYDNGSDGVNLIRNGSFEAGVSGVGLMSLTRTLGLDAAWDDTVAWHGRASLRIPTTNGQNMLLITRPIVCKTNRIYVASFRAKSTGTNTGLIRMKSPFTAPSGFTATLDSQRTVSVTTNWTLVSITNRVLAYPFAEINVTAQLTGIGSQTNWIDAFSLQDYTATNYVAESAIELAFQSGRIANIYFDDESVTVPIRLHNSTTGSLSGHISVLGYDWRKREVLSEYLPYTLAAAATNSVSVTIPAGLKGSFTLIAYDSEHGGEPDEATISVVPRPKQLAAEDSKFGGHALGDHWPMRVYTNLGIHHVRWLSPGAFFRIGLVLGLTGSYNYYDDYTSVPTNYGIVALGNLTQTSSTNFNQKRTFFRITNYSGTFQIGENVRGVNATGYLARAMTTADFTGNALVLSNVLGVYTNSLPLVTGQISGAIASILGVTKPAAVPMDIWSNYVANLSAHYSNIIPAWEVSNEPAQETSYLFGDAALYSDFLRETIQAIRVYQPTAKIVALGGPGGSSTNFAGTVLTNMASIGLTNEIAEMSFHIYPTADQEAPLAQAFSALWGIPWINSESGMVDYGPKSFFAANMRRQGTPVELFNTAKRFYVGNGWVSAMILRNALTTLGHKAKRFYAYDHRSYDPAYYGQEYGQIEYDDTLKPNAVALACAAGMIDGSTSLGLANTNTGINSYVWQYGTGTNTIVSVHSRSYVTNWLCTMPGGMYPYVRYDMFGNPVGTNEASFHVAGYPYYLSMTNSASTVLTNFAEAVFAVASDVSAPVPVVAQWPAVPAFTTAQRTLLRWFALDDIKHPVASTGATNLVYAVRVQPRDSDFRSWSAGTEIDMAGWSPGRHRATVRALDGDNIGETSRTFWIGPTTNSAATARTATAGTMNAR